MVDIKRKIKKLTNDFDLIYRPDKYKYILCSKEEIIIRNFLGSCPDPDYAKYSNQKTNAAKNLLEFIKSKEFKQQLKQEHGCVISQSAIKNEIKFAKNIPDSSLRRDVLKFYYKLAHASMRESILIYRPKNMREKIFNEVLLHEYIHVLLEDNRIRIRSWKWNEGLVAYMFHLVLHNYRFEKKPRPIKNKMLNVYNQYAHKWSMLLDNVYDPKERKRIILNTIKKLK